MTGGQRRVAAFDFDGTITRGDTLGPFLVEVCGRSALYRAMATRAPVLGASLVGLADRDREKELLVGKLLGGREQRSVQEAGQRYAARLTREQPYREAALERLAWHRAEGHAIVIVSASLDVYLDPLATQLGVDHVICTSLEVGADGRLTGKLRGDNVRGPEKARLLTEWLGAGEVELWAYGDSRGDREMLAMATHPTRVTA